MNLQKIPATIVTGFLGSGKTTLLANVIRQASGRRIAVIVNEFGELDVDAQLLRGCPLNCTEDAAVSEYREDGIYELANGCICCTVEEEFLPVMEQLTARRDDIDHILIETSGLALPKPLVQAFNWPQIKQHCTVDAVITVVDGAAVAQGGFAHDPDAVRRQREADASLDHEASLQELFADQLSAADMIIISKRDQLTEVELQQVEKLITSRVRPGIRMLEVTNGEIDSRLLMGLNQASEETIECLHTHHDHHHAQGEKHRHAHEDFNAVAIELDEVDSDATLQKIQDMVARYAIYRVKGFLALPGRPMRQVIHGVGCRFDRYFDRIWRTDEPRKSRIVFIGQELEHDRILRELADECSV